MNVLDTNDLLEILKGCPGILHKYEWNSFEEFYMSTKLLFLTEYRNGWWNIELIVKYYGKDYSPELSVKDGRTDVILPFLMSSLYRIKKWSDRKELWNIKWMMLEYFADLIRYQDTLKCVELEYGGTDDVLKRMQEGLRKKNITVEIG